LPPPFLTHKLARYPALRFGTCSKERAWSEIKGSFTPISGLHALSAARTLMQTAPIGMTRHRLASPPYKRCVRYQFGAIIRDDKDLLPRFFYTKDPISAGVTSRAIRPVAEVLSEPGGSPAKGVPVDGYRLNYKYLY
jgi:hypothetical protein